MDVKLACGDNNIGKGDIDITTDQADEKYLPEENSIPKEVEKDNVLCDEGKSQIDTTNEKDLNLKERIANCKKIIESLKQELADEKAKLQESKSSEVTLPDPLSADHARCCTGNIPFLNNLNNETISVSDTNYECSSSIDTKLRCDDNLMEYEKQLQRYQDTLTMAQTEKKNAIRKQMLTKAYKLKLLEVENQCNIEILRVKQSLQCLEPLKSIVNKWKTDESNITCDSNSYELIPRYPELNSIPKIDMNIFTDDEKSEFVATSEDA